MALIVGTDSYITLADADLYIAANYMSTDTRFIAWDALTDANKEVVLRKATQIIDRLPLVGVKSTSTQVLKFPRALYTDAQSYSVNTVFTFDGMYVQSETPQDVLDAQCEIALDLGQGVNDRAELQRQGVKSFSLGKLSETYGSVKDVTSFEARRLLAQFTAGGVRII